MHNKQVLIRETEHNTTELPPWYGQTYITWGLNRFYGANLTIHTIVV